MKYNFIKDLKWHILLLVLSVFFICKFSSAPPIFDEFNIIFSRPQEDTIIYEFFRIAENLSLAYIASLIFYLIVDYIPSKKEQSNTARLLEKELFPLYMYMDIVVSYFNYSTGVSDFKKATDEEKQKIDEFYFPTSVEYLMVQSIRNGKFDGEHLELFEAKKEIISAGKKILEKINAIDEVLRGNKMPSQFIVLINEIRCSAFLEKILKVMTTQDIIINGHLVKNTYISFYKDLLEFSNLKNKLENYSFLKISKTYRMATSEEIKEWIEYQIKVRKEYPELEQVLEQINSRKMMYNKQQIVDINNIPCTDD